MDANGAKRVRAATRRAVTTSVKTTMKCLEEEDIKLLRNKLSSLEELDAQITTRQRDRGSSASIDCKFACVFACVFADSIQQCVQLLSPCSRSSNAVESCPTTEVRNGTFLDGNLLLEYTSFILPSKAALIPIQILAESTNSRI